MAPVGIADAEYREFSPLLMAKQWSEVGRLLVLVICSTIGSIMNGFFVAAFFIERNLKRHGNVFHACAGFADLIITVGIIPTCAVVLLSGAWDTDPVCSVVHFFAVGSTYCYNIFFMLVATESYYRQCRTAEEYAAIINSNIGILAVSVFVMSFMVAAVGVFFEMDYNYCTRLNFGNYYFRIATAVLLQVIPFIITIFGLIRAYIQVRRRGRKKSLHKRSQLFKCEKSTTALNISAYLLFVMAWIPYLVIVHKYPNITDSYFYYCVLIGICRSIFTTCLYALLNRIFRHAFARLFKYCCCKNALSTSFKGRHRRNMEYRLAHKNIRVHIMHAYGAPLYSSSSRDTQDL